MHFKNFTFIIICFLCFSFSQISFSQNNAYRTHTVSKGETAYSIASSYNIPVEELYRLNPGSEKGLKIKDVLRIPTQKDVSQPYVFHSIQAKETLYSVSKLYNISIDEIIALNPGLTTGSFKMGTVVKIPKQAASAVTVNKAGNASNSKSSIKHTVRAKETLYSLSKLYNISMSDIADANPEIKSSGLKKDMVLIIPEVKKVAPIPEKEVVVASTSTAPVVSAPKGPSAAQPAYTPVSTAPAAPAISTNAPVTSKTTVKETGNVMKVGLLLPFLDQKDGQRDRFVEYYEGFLLAVQDIKEKGYSAEIYVFDISKGKNTKKLESLLDTYEMKDLDIIIGGVSDEEIAIMTKFAQSQNIKYAIPFPVKNEVKLAEASNVFQVNIPLSQLYSKAAFTFCKEFRNYNVIILEDSSDKNKADFISVLKKNLSISAMQNKTIQISPSLESDIRIALTQGVDNIIIPASGSMAMLGKIMPTLRNIKTQIPDISVKLFGYPEWQAYAPQYLQDFFRFETYIYSSFYAYSNDVSLQKFMNRYINWYGKTLLNTYPKYGLLGYDTGLYFMTALAQYGKSFDDNLLRIKVPTLQSVFNFEEVSAHSGYMNTGLYFIHYKPDMTIEKIDLSK